MDDSTCYERPRGSGARERLVVAGLTIIGLAACIPRSLAISNTFVYSDESFTWRVCQAPFVEMLQRVGADTLPPLHFVLLHAWIAAFGDSALAMRLPSVLAGVLCVPLIFLVVREACRTLTSASAAGLLAAALVAAGAVQVTHSRVMRPYPLAALLGLLATWLLLRALRPWREAEEDSAPVRWWIAYGLSAGLFCLAHHFALFTLAAHGVFIAGFAARLAIRREAAAARAVARGAAWSALVAAVVYSPWAPVFLAQTRRAQAWFWVPELGPVQTAAMAYQWNVGEAPASMAVAVAALGAFLLAAWWTMRRAPLAGCLFSLMFAMPWLLTILVSTCAGRPLLQERYLLFANAGLLALLGATFATIPQRPARILYVAALALAFLPATIDFLRTLPHAPPAMEQAAAWLKERHQPGDVVTVSLPQTVNIVKYYAQRQGFEVDARAFVTPAPNGGQPIHTTSLASADLLVDGPHAPPRGARRWWKLETKESADVPRDGWRLLAVRTFTGPPGTREVAGSEFVRLELWERE